MLNDNALGTSVLQPGQSTTTGLEVSIVIPCLNEAETVAACVIRARESLKQHGIAGEVIVADNLSTDASASIAAAAGARLVTVETEGYGAALTGGIASAGGRFVVMGDADGSYDFAEAPKLVEMLRDRFDLVVGCRLPKGGGRVLPGAMPFLHRWVGNPGLSWLARRLFCVPVHDVYCGLRGFRWELWRSLGLTATGMEWAPELIVKAAMRDARICELPITLYPDQRKVTKPHLRTFADGFRTLRMLIDTYRLNQRRDMPLAQAKSPLRQGAES